ncbi:hypothetical protein [Paenibacillus glycanilyticus]|uniref:hypothetical protein n=1 Tax=Paenibacillus glycanilyticus TaxID=126569 RepID=UPI003EBAF419
MKGLYRLHNIQFASMLPVLLILTAGMIVTPYLLLQSAAEKLNENSVHPRFESLYATTGCKTALFAFIAVFCVYFLVKQYNAYWGSKSIYTYLTLPVKREAFYWSNLISFTIGLLLLFAGHLLAIRWGYSAYASHIGSYADGRFVMHNGLFLAFIRSNFLKVLLPISISGWVASVSMLVSLATGLYYAFLCERGRRHWHIILVIAAGWIMRHILNAQIAAPDLDWTMAKLYAYSIALFLLSGFFIWHSMRLVRRGVIA